MNKLATWLKDRGIKRIDFAKRIAVSPAYLTQICADPPAYWPSRDVFEAISRETSGDVTPNDFMGEAAAE